MYMRFLSGRGRVLSLLPRKVRRSRSPRTFDLRDFDNPTPAVAAGERQRNRPVTNRILDETAWEVPSDTAQMHLNDLKKLIEVEFGIS